MRWTNAKLEREIVNDILLEKNISSIDISLLLALIPNSNAMGAFKNVSCKNICLELNISDQAFYDSLYRLDRLGYIKLDWSNRKDWSGIILNNVFLTKNDDKNYMRTNMPFLYSKEFNKLKANEKKIVLKLNMDMKKDKGMEIYPETIGSWIGITNKSLILSYIENIKQFFPCYFKDGKQGLLVCFKKSPICALVSRGTEAAIYLVNKIKNFCRVNRVNYTIDAIKDVVHILTIQYANRDIDNLVMGVITDSMILKKNLQPRLINSNINRKIYEMLNNKIITI